MYKNVPLNAYREKLKFYIMRYSREQFSKVGVRALKMGDIAQHIMMSKRTLYEIFDGKEALLMACMEAQQEEFQQQMKEFMSEERGVLEIVVESIRLHLKGIESTCPQFFTDIQQMPRIMAYFKKRTDKRSLSTAEFLRRGVEEGVIRDDVDFKIILDLMRHVQDQKVMVELYKRHSLPNVHRNIIVFCLRGICTQEGMAQLDALLEKMDAEQRGEK